MSQSDYSRVAAAIGYLCLKAREQPDLGTVAAAVGLSEWHFQRVFQRWAGISPKRFLQFLTLGHARHLLDHSVRIVDATLAVGLSSPGRLHDLFVNLECMTPGQFKQRGLGLAVDWAILPTLLGPALFAQLDGRLVALSFLAGDDAPAALAELGRRWPEARFSEAPAALEPHRRILADRLRGRAQEPLALTLRGTPFQLQVWEALLRIPEGWALTYHDLARLVGPNASARSVGATIRQNPIACLIPCHRVIKASGAFGFYYWGAPRKEALLALEQARVRPAVLMGSDSARCSGPRPGSRPAS